MSAAHLVKGCPLFHEIYDEEVEKVLKDCLVASYEVGDKIVTQGEEGTDIFVILTGEADIKVTKDGKEQFIATIGKGDLFGEMVLINETTRTADIVCSQRAEVLIMTFENFFSYFKKNPKVFALMVLNVTRLVTKRLKNSNKTIENLNSKIVDLENGSKAA